MNIIFECIMSFIVMLVVLAVAYETFNEEVTLRTPRKMIKFFILRFILYINTIYNFYLSLSFVETAINTEVSGITLVDFLLFFVWSTALILAWIFIGIYFIDETSSEGLISSYNDQKSKGQKIPYKVFKNFYTLYPDYVTISSGTFYINEPDSLSPKERFYFGFFDFVKVMFFLARQELQTKSIAEKPNTSVTRLMQQIIEKDIEQTHIKMRAAAEERIKIIHNIRKQYDNLSSH